MGLIGADYRNVWWQIGGEGGVREGGRRNYFDSQVPTYSEVCGCIGLNEILQSVQKTRTKSAQETYFKMFCFGVFFIGW